MPTYEWTARFRADFDGLTAVRQVAFLAAVAAFVADRRSGARVRAGLRVKGVQGAPGVFEMTWAPDGRATFAYGEPVRPEQPHVIWRRIGTHDIFREP